ncbi:metalloregulator ArsR/SmtB family transcription factor [Rhizobium sp. AU243]|uniref:ArsR/SmtB family transcription factor n=1 Tax=Rhizobium sp. AU243 TaxID=2303425 RepID=UPI00256FB31E|nr:metalloregulator ArsR/SmtB family transcription factor [Rhizobium sp. AU243]
MSQEPDNPRWQSVPDRPTGTILHFRKDGNPRKCYDETHGNLRGRTKMRRLSEQDSSLYFRRCSQVLSVLSNAKRLEVVLTLLKGERSVTQLAHQIDLSQSALSQHLAKMREAGVVETRRHGLVVYYRIARLGLSGLLEEVKQFLEANPEKE